jgi:hypothetical protein
VGFAVDMVEMGARYILQFIGSSLQCDFIKATYSKVIHECWEPLPLSTTLWVNRDIQVLKEKSVETGATEKVE